jgi:hypothetical protein
LEFGSIIVAYISCKCLVRHEINSHWLEKFAISEQPVQQYVSATAIGLDTYQMICTFVQNTLFGVQAANPILLGNHMLMLLSDVL